KKVDPKRTTEVQKAPERQDHKQAGTGRKTVQRMGMVIGPAAGGDCRKSSQSAESPPICLCNGANSSI
ncbi:hypothetical protein, partial [Rhizobium ecuadorense]|uniref:hypothetical protein n=1 Tax=Rhizobium ecuadorense TaxID=1671795 RepID=UPI000AC2A616